MDRRSIRVAGLLAFTCLIILAGCSPKPSPPAPAPATGGYDGATRSAGNMVATDNRCQFAFLYDDFRTFRRADGSVSPPRGNERDAVLRGPAHVAGASVKVSVRGAYSGDAGPIGTVLVEYGGARMETTLTTDGKDPGAIFSEVMAAATAGDNLVKVTVSLADLAKGQKEQLVDIDSMEVVLDGEFCKSGPNQ